MSKFIPITELKDRFIYRLKSRNLIYGVWDADRQGFMGIREKLGSEYLFMEYEYSTSEVCGTAFALQEMFEIPAEVSLNSILRKFDKHSGRDVIFTTPVARGGRGWVYVDDGASLDDLSGITAVNNDALFNILKPLNDEALIAEIDERLNKNRELFS